MRVDEYSELSVVVLAGILENLRESVALVTPHRLLTAVSDVVVVSQLSCVFFWLRSAVSGRLLCAVFLQTLQRYRCLPFLAFPQEIIVPLHEAQSFFRNIMEHISIIMV